MGAGTGGVLLLRWYWWRINAWSEISSMSAAVIVSLSLRNLQFSGNSSVVFAKIALITTVTTTVVWLITTLLTQPESEERLLRFYKRVRPTVHGWKHIAVLAPEIRPVRDLGSTTFDWIMGCALVYCSMFSVGELVLQECLPAFLPPPAAPASHRSIYRLLSPPRRYTLTAA